MLLLLSFTLMLPFAFSPYAYPVRAEDGEEEEPEVLFFEDFENAGAPGWTFGEPYPELSQDQTSSIGIADGWLAVNNWHGYREAVYEQVFEGTFSFSVDVRPNVIAGGGHWNATRILFHYQDEGNYYALTVGNGDQNASNVSLFKVENGSDPERLLLVEDPYLFDGTTARLQIVAEESGHISVYAMQQGQVTLLIDRFHVATFTSGKIGLGVRHAVARYDNVLVTRGVHPLEPPAVDEPDVPSMEDGNFTVTAEGKILDPEGREFVAKGVNVNGPRWPWPRDTLQDVGLIADVWKFNTVRVAMFPRMAHWNISHNLDLDGIVRAFTSRRIVTILENHDFTGDYPGDEDRPHQDGSTLISLEALKDYWKDLAETYKDNPYVWFNVLNEPGPGGLSKDASLERWKEVHLELIEAIRSTGAQNVIVLDGHHWGQEYGFRNGVGDSAILTHGPAINEQYDNIVYSLHMYGEWSGGQERLEQYLDLAAEKGLAVIIGEYGASPDPQTVSATMAMFNAAVPRGVGRIAWAWAGGDAFLLTEDGGGWAIDRKDGSRPTNLSWFGTLAWEDNHGTLTLPVTNDLPLLVNGNFEEPLDGTWLNWGNRIQAPGEGLGGSAAFKVPAGGPGGGGQFVIAAEPNTTYKLTIWGRVSAPAEPGDADAGFQYRPTDSSPDEDQIKHILSFTSTEWTKQEVVFTTGPQVARANVFIWKNRPDIDFWVDDITLVKADPSEVPGEPNEPEEPEEPGEPEDPQHDFEIRSVVFRNADGVVTAMPESGWLQADAEVFNRGGARTVTLIVALYDAGGDIAALSAVSAAIPGGETHTFSGGFNLPANAAGYAAKVMVWDDLERMTPLAEAVELGGTN